MSPADLEKILTALVLFDLKHGTGFAPEYTGCDNVGLQPELVVKMERPHHRIPIPGHNDSDEQLAALLALRRKRQRAPVNIMPYHRYGTGKYKMLDLPYQLDDLKPPERLQRAKEIFNSLGLSEIKI